tara:strand:- start:1686 stop:1814 length:129 start_codon:yes stop_codon:yes gene_type:complete
METIIKKFNELLKNNNLKPVKIIKLKTGIICKHYKNGNIKII